MNYGPLLFLGAFLTFASAWFGLVFVPHMQLKDLQPQVVEGVANPKPYGTEEIRGRQVYQSEGCVYCHSQQVRGGQYLNDIERGWGERRSVPRDYLYDRPLLLGTMRTGPDLVNIGKRQPSAAWHHQHLYDPQLITPGSIMAPFAYLYEKRPIVGQPSLDAIPFPFIYVTLKDASPQSLEAAKAAGFRPAEQRGTRWVGGFDPARLEKLRSAPGVQLVEPYVEPGQEIVPTPAAKALVAYLKSLDRSYPLEGAQP